MKPSRQLQQALHSHYLKSGGTQLDFPGAKIILDELARGPNRHLVGLLANGARPVRDGVLLKKDGKEIGIITSGFRQASIGLPALGFVDGAYAKAGTQLTAATKGTETQITVAKLPLVTHRYFRG